MLMDFLEMGVLVGGVLVLKSMHANKEFWIERFKNLYEEHKEANVIASKKKEML